MPLCRRRQSILRPQHPAPNVLVFAMVYTQRAGCFCQMLKRGGRDLLRRRRRRLSKRSRTARRRGSVLCCLPVFVESIEMSRCWWCNSCILTWEARCASMHRALHCAINWRRRRKQVSPFLEFSVCVRFILTDGPISRPSDGRAVIPRGNSWHVIDTHDRPNNDNLELTVRRRR